MIDTLTDSRKHEADALRKHQAIKQAEDFARLLAQPEAQAFFNQLLERCGVYQTSYSTEPLDMAFREGRRSIGLWLLAQFEQCPHLYLTLLNHERTDEYRHPGQSDSG